MRMDIQDEGLNEGDESLKHLQKHDLNGYVSCYWAEHVKGRFEKELEISILDLFR